MNKSLKLLSLLVLPLMLASCSDEGEHNVNEAEQHDWTEADKEVFAKLNSKANDKLVHMPYDDNLFNTYKITTPDEKGGDPIITYESNYGIFFNSDVNRVMFTLTIEEASTIDAYFETVKATEGWLEDTNKTNASAHDYYAYYELDFEGDDFEADSTRSMLRLNAYQQNDLMYVTTYVDTIHTYSSWPKDAINHYTNLDSENMNTFRSFTGKVDEIKLKAIKLGGIDYVSLDIESSDANALTDYRNHIINDEVVKNPTAPVEDQIKIPPYKVESYHDFSKTKDNYYANESYLTTYEGSQYRVDASLNIYLDKDTTAKSQTSFNVLLNLDSQLSYV